MFDVLIIGAGPAGLTAGIYCARGRQKTGIVEMGLPGGQAAQTERIDNYPGFPTGVSGYELTNGMFQQAQNCGAEFIYAQVEELDLSGPIKKVKANSETYEAKAVIIAAGSMPKPLGTPGESKFHGRGVSYCAICDAAFFKGKRVAVVGGGDSALEEAVYLTRFTEQVTIIHRRSGFRASQIAVEEAQKNPHIRFELDTVIEEIYGNSQVEGVRLKNVNTGETKELLMDGVFIYVGTQPNDKFLHGELNVNESGYIITDPLLRTNIPGVFAAGDIRNTPLRQVATAVGDGALAGVEVEKYLAEQNKSK